MPWNVASTRFGQVFGFHMLGGMELIAAPPSRVGLAGSPKSKTSTFEGGCGRSFQIEDSPVQIVTSVKSTVHPSRVSGADVIVPGIKLVIIGSCVAIAARKRLTA